MKIRIRNRPEQLQLIYDLKLELIVRNAQIQMLKRENMDLKNEKDKLNLKKVELTEKLELKEIFANMLAHELAQERNRRTPNLIK